MGFLKSIFGKKEAAARQLTRPHDLLAGDLITLDDSFALPKQLKGQQLKVESVNTYEFENKLSTEWQLKGVDDQAIYLTLDEDDEVYLALSMKITRDQVEQIFDLDQFSQVFEEPGEARVQVLVNQPFDELKQWLGEHYQQTSFAEFGYFHNKDYRGSRPPQDEGHGKGEEFESYQLIDDAEKYAVDIEVYDGGETEISLVMYRPVTDIREYWPAS